MKKKKRKKSRKISTPKQEASFQSQSPVQLPQTQTCCSSSAGLRSQMHDTLLVLALSLAGP